MKSVVKPLLAMLAAATACLAQAVPVSLTVSFSQAFNSASSGFQVAAVKLSNVGPQGFSSAGADFSLDVGDSFSFDAFVVQALLTQIDGNDGIQSPFALQFVTNFGTATVAGVTYAQTVNGVTFGVIDFAGPATLDAGNGTQLVISLADSTYNAGTATGFFTPGKSAGRVISPEVSLQNAPVAQNVPEPGALPLALLALGLLGAAGRRRGGPIAA